MTQVRMIAFATLAAVGLSACASEVTLDSEAPTDVVVITHTGKGTLYWQ